MPYGITMQSSLAKASTHRIASRRIAFINDTPFSRKKRKEKEKLDLGCIIFNVFDWMKTLKNQKIKNTDILSVVPINLISYIDALSLEQGLGFFHSSSLVILLQ